MPDHDVLFGASLGQWNGADAADAAGRIRLATQADRDGLDLFTVADHPYFGDKLDAYALTGFLLGQTERITGMVTVTNLPSRPAPVLARTLTSLSALSGGRVILGIGAGAIRDMIVKLGIPRLDGGPRCAPWPRRSRWSAPCPAGESRSPSTANSTTYPNWTRPPRRPRGSSPARSARIPGRHRTAGRRLDPAGRLGLAEPALPRIAPPRRRRRGRGGPGPGGDRQRLQLRRPHHRRTARRHPGRGRPLDRRLRPAVGRRAHHRRPRAPRGRLHLPQHRRHPRRRGPGPLGHRDSPRRPRSDHPIGPASAET